MVLSLRSVSIVILPSPNALCFLALFKARRLSTFYQDVHCEPGSVFLPAADSQLLIRNWYGSEKCQSQFSTYVISHLDLWTWTSTTSMVAFLFYSKCSMCLQKAYGSYDGRVCRYSCY